MKNEKIIEINFDKKRLADMFQEDKKQFILPLCALGMSAVGGTLIVTASILNFLH